MLRIFLTLSSLPAALIGAWLVYSGEIANGLTFLIYGVVGLSVIVNRERQRAHAAAQEKLVNWLEDEINVRIARGESPDAIAAALEPRGVVPIVLLQLTAKRALRAIDEGADPDERAHALGWLVSSNPPAPVPERDLAGLNPRTTLHALTAGVIRFADDGSAEQWRGVFIATRWHLIFVTNPDDQLLATEFVKGAALGWIPQAISTAKDTLDLATAVRQAFEKEYGPKQIAQFVGWYTLPGNLVIPWREVTAVAKTPSPEGIGRADMVITTASAQRHRFRLDTGRDDFMLEYWIELTRIAAALQGVLVPPRA